jgi:hypothetical protein
MRPSRVSVNPLANAGTHERSAAIAANGHVLFVIHFYSSA